jgi:hypothetical protein
MNVKIIQRQNSETGYTYQIAGHSRSTSNENVHCNATSNEDSTRVNCHGSGTTDTTTTDPLIISYSVTGATYSLLLPGGRVAVVNCASKTAYGWYTPPGVKRGCRTPLVDDIQVEFKKSDAKLKWPVSIDGKKFESETYRILGVLDSAAK